MSIDTVKGMSDTSDMPDAIAAPSDKTPSRRERNLADVRERATTLAECIVLEKGGEAVNARSLAKQLGVSVGTLYNAFGDLDGVFRAVNSRCANRLAAVLGAAAERSAASPRDRVVSIGEAYMDFALSEPRRWWMLFQRDMDTTADPESLALQEELLRMLVGAGGGNPDSPEHRQFFLLLWASVHGLVSLAVRPSIAAIDPRVARRHIADLVDAAYRSMPVPASDSRAAPPA